ncbi:transposase [Nocardia salmonicida]|uniref:transposase n=1 Tax=Nocardia salmonicida TaxID=53431 RepID=UPI0037114257
MRVSHEAIYLTLFDPRRKAIDRTLTRRLRTGRLTRHPKQARRPDARGPIYLCKPRSPWQRGKNENTNRPLRQYLPKKADLRRFSQTDLDAIAHELNHRQRKIHGYRSPVEVYAQHLNRGDALTV